MPEGDEWRKKAKGLRLAQRMSQADLGELLGVSAGYISFIESGKRKPDEAPWRWIFEALGAHDEAAGV